MNRILDQEPGEGVPKAGHHNGRVLCPPDTRPAPVGMLAYLTYPIFTTNPITMHDTIAPRRSVRFRSVQFCCSVIIIMMCSVLQCSDLVWFFVLHHDARHTIETVPKQETKSISWLWICISPMWFNRWMRCMWSESSRRSVAHFIFVTTIYYVFRHYYFFFFLIRLTRTNLTVFKGRNIGYRVSPSLSLSLRLCSRNGLWTILWGFR